MSEAPERIWLIETDKYNPYRVSCSTAPHSPDESTEYVRADRIEVLDREVKELRDHCEAMEVEHRQAIEAMQAAAADKARLSEALAGLCDWIENEVGVEMPFDARAALSGSGSGWRLVPYLWQCKDYADGWLSYTNEDEAQAYQRDTGCAVRITYRPLPAAPQQGGE